MYQVGISTGMWGIGKDPALLGLAQKIGGLGATGGIQFVQVDLETVAEFAEPQVEEQIKRMKSKLGMIAGLHGEIGELMALDSAEKRFWDQTHRRLCQTVRYAAQLGFFYVNIHFSNRQLISFTEAQHRTQGFYYPVVGPDGRGLQNITKGNPKTEQEAKKHITVHLQRSESYRRKVREIRERKMSELPKRIDEDFQREIRNNPNLSEQEKTILREQIKRKNEIDINQEIENEVGTYDFLFKVWLDLKDEENEKYQLDDGEWGAYHLVAHWMKEKGDYFWSTIARGENPEKLYFEDENEFCAAVASKYIEGHLTIKNTKANMDFLEGMSVKEWCEKKKLYLLLENPESGGGAEGLYRLFHPNHFYHTIKRIGSPFIRICIDFEHMVSQQLNPDIVLKEVPNDFGSLIVLFHLGQPLPYGGMSHIPVSRGSLAQEQIYRWLFWLRKKGWKSGYMMFERGGGRTSRGTSPYEVFEDSVTALRQIAIYLEKEVDYKNLPPEFYGISAQNPGVYNRQLVTVREHAWDPLEGVLNVPEEKHTFLSKTAVERGKAQEWEKRKYR